MKKGQLGSQAGRRMVQHDLWRLRQERARQLLGKLHEDGYVPYWRELAQRCAPRVGRFIAGQRGREGQIRHHSILDGTGIYASQTLAAGFVGGACSPARPWWRTYTQDPDLMKFQPVAEWIQRGDQVVRDILEDSNFYQASYRDFLQAGVFGNFCGLLLEHDEKVLHQQSLALGEWAPSRNQLGEVDALARKFAMTTQSMVETFGWENCSDAVQACWNRGELSKWWTVVHLIEPRSHRDPGSFLAKDMPYASVYWEEARGDGTYLRESGFDHWPVICCAWEREDGDLFGYGPGSNAYGDLGSLQHQTLRNAQILDTVAHPAMEGPPEHSQDEASFLPGGYRVNERTGTNPTRPIYEGQVQALPWIRENRGELKQQIERAFYADLFLLIDRLNDTTQRTAKEIAQRAEDRLVQIGPVMTVLDNGKFQPTIQFGWRTAMRRGLIPPPPPELDGQPLLLQFTSIFAQAQRLIGVQMVDRFLGTIYTLSERSQEVLDRVNFDGVVDWYADAYNTPARLLVPTDEAQRVRTSRGRALAAQQQAESAATAAKAVQSLGSTPAGDQTALDVLAGQTGYNSPPAYQIQE